LTGEHLEGRRAASSWAWEAGPYGIEPVAPLLADPDPNIRLNARRALWSIVHHSTLPGADKERRLAGEALARVLLKRHALKLPVEEQKQLMRMIAVAAFEEKTTRIVEGLLEDRALDEMALFALERIPHPAAEKALIKALESGGGPAIVCGAARALAARQSKAAIPALITLAECSQGETEAKVRHVLARMGDPLAEEFLSASAQAKKPGAIKDLLLFAENRLERGDKRGALKLFKNMLGQEEEHLRAAAVRGVGLSGNIISHRDIMNMLGHESAAVRDAAYQALLSLPGEKVLADLKSAFPHAGDLNRVGILKVLTRRKDPEAPSFVLGALKDSTPEVRYTAFELLGEFNDPALESVILEAAERTSPQEREAALESYLRHANQRLSRGEKEKALDMFHRLLREDPASPVVSGALQGVIAIGSFDSLEKIRALADEPNLREDVSWARLAIATRIMEEDRDLALSIFDKVCRECKSRSLRQKAAAKLRALGEDTTTYARSRGFLVEWHLLGPFPRLPEENFDDHPFDPNYPDLSRIHEAGDQKLSWEKRITEDLDGVVDLLWLNPHEKVFAFAYCEFLWDREEEAVFKVGSDDGVAVWLNGELVHSNPATRGLTVDEDEVEVRLQAGQNRLLVKVTQGGGDWQFCVRIADVRDNAVEITE
jgi:HEAT repeat protein